MRTYVSALALLAAVSMATGVDAEVYKCKGTDGKIVYSGTPCSGQAEVIPGHRLSGNTVASPVDSRATSESVPAGMGRSREELAQPGKCYEESELRDIDVRLPSQIYSQADRRFFGDERRRIVGCALARLTPEEKRMRAEALRDLGRAGNKTDVAPMHDRRFV